MENYQVLLSEYNDCIETYKKKFEQKLSQKDLFEYNEVLFSTHSCAIENNTFSVNDTRALKEHGLNLKLHNKSLREAFEILDHFKAFEYLFNDLNMPLTEKLILNTQKLLTLNTQLYSTGKQPGEYSDTIMAAGDTIFGDAKENQKSIPMLMEQAQEALDKNQAPAIEISARFHQYFIYLHPFPDGNGRVGRLISNYILAKKNEPLVIITNEQKNKYIEALKASNKHKDMAPICSFFIHTSIHRMKSELNQLNNKIPDTIPNKKSKGLSFIF